MSYSQKYCLVSFIEPIDVGTKFHMSDWPIHITFADVFAVEHASEIQQTLADLLAKHVSFTVHIGKDSVLGTTPVTLVEKSAEMQNLHNTIVDLLELHGATFNTPEFTREGFLPHSTIQKTGRLNTGAAVAIRSISLVDMFPGGDWQQRNVLSNFNLKDAAP